MVAVYVTFTQFEIDSYPYSTIFQLLRDGLHCIFDKKYDYLALSSIFNNKNSCRCRVAYVNHFISKKSKF